MAPQQLKNTNRLADDTLDTLRRIPAQANQDIVDAVQEAENAGERAEFLERFREKFRSLDVKIQNEITQNLENLSQRSTSRQLDMLRLEVGALRTERNTETKVDTSVKTEKGFFENAIESVKESDVNPQNWSERTKSTAKGVGVATVTAATAYGAFRFAKWFFTGAKKAKVKATETAKRGTAKVALIVALGLAAAASFVGWKVLEKSIFGKLNEKLADAEAALQHAKENARKVQEKIQAMPDQISQSMQLQQQEVLQKLETAQKRRDDLILALDKRVEESEEQKVKEEEQKKKKEQERQKEEQKKKDEELEKKQIVIPQTRSQLLAKGILFLHPAAADSFQNVHFHDAIEMLADDKNMGEIFSMIAPDGFVKLTDDIVIEIRKRGDTDSRTHAVEHLIHLCALERDAVEIALRASKQPKKTSVEKLKLRAYIDLFGSGTQSVLTIATRLKSFDGDWKKLAANMEFNELFSESGELDPYIHELYTQEDDIKSNVEHAKGAVDLLAVAATYGSQSVKGFIADMDNKKKNGSVFTGHERVLYKICTEMTKDSPALFVKPFFHDISPYEDFPADSMESVHNIIEHRMPISLVTRMYMYRRMVQDKKVSGILLAQADIARYIANPPYTMGIIDSLKHGYRVGKLTSRVSELATNKGWGEFMGYMEEGDISIPPEMWSNASKMAKALAVKGGEGIANAFMAILYSGLAGVGILSEHKIATGSGLGIVGGAGYLASRMGINSQDLSLGLDHWNQTVTGKHWRPYKWVDRMYRKIPWITKVPTITDAHGNFDNVTSAINELEKKLGGNSKRLMQIHEMRNSAVLHADDVGAWEKLGNALRAEGHIEAGNSAIAIGKDVDQRLAISKIRFYRKELWKKFFFTPGRVVDFGVSKSRELSRRPFTGWRKANGLERAGYTAGVGMHALALKGDIDQYYEIKEQTKAMREHVAGTMRELRAKLSADSHFKKTGAYTFMHKTSGVEVSLHIPASVDKVLGSQVDTQTARTILTGSTLLTSVLMGAKTFSGPAGLAVMGVEVVVRTGVDAWEQGKVREFIADAPPWLLVQFGTEGSTKLSEHDLLSKASTWMISDIFPSLDDTDKKGIRTKMLYVMFNHDLGTYAPELLGEVYAGVENPLELDNFYKEDFSSIVLPAFSTFLFAGVRDDSVQWSSMKEQDIVSGKQLKDTVLNAPDATLSDIRKAMRLATTYYLQHIREKRYVTNLMALKEDRANAEVLYRDMQKSGEDVSLESLVDPDLKQLISELGGVSVFGKKLDTLSLQNEEFSSYKTRAQRSLEIVHKRINDTFGETRADKKYNMPNVFSVLSSEVQGLDRKIDFSDASQMFGFLSPAQRQQMQHVFAETFAEQKEKEGLLWNDWKGQAAFLKKQAGRNIMTPPSHIMGVDPSSVQYSLLGAAVNNIRSELGLEKVHKGYENFSDALDTELGLLLGFGTSHSTRSTEANFRYLLTKSATDLLEGPASVKVRERVRRNADVEHTLYNDMPHQPVVLTRGSVDKQACMKLRYPDVDKKDFPPEALQAVLFEEDSLPKSGEYSSVILATYIYGDIAQKKITVLQSSTATSMLSTTKLSRATGSSNGLALAYSVKEALRKPGMQAVLSQVPTALQEQEAERAQRKNDVKKLQEQQKVQEREWREQTAPQEFQKAVDSVEKNPDSYVRIGKSNQYLFYDSSKKQFFTFLPSDYGNASVAPAPKYAYGENRIKPPKERRNIIVTHKSKEDALHFYRQKNTTQKLPKDAQEFRTLNELNMQYNAIKPYITQPVTRTQEDVFRVIDLADQIAIHPRWVGDTRFYGAELKHALGSLYEKLNTDQSRALFLNELLQFLRTNKNTVDANASAKIRTWFEKHPQMFERENW